MWMLNTNKRIGMTEKQYAEIMGRLSAIEERQLSLEFQKLLMETLQKTNQVLERQCEVLEVIKDEDKTYTDDPDLLC